MAWGGIGSHRIAWYGTGCSVSRAYAAPLRDPGSPASQPGITARLAAQQDTPGVYSPARMQRSPAFTPLRSQVEGACGSAAHRALHLPDGRRAHLDGRDHGAQCRLHRPGMHVCIHARSMRTPRARCACAAYPLHMSAAYHTRCSGHPLRHEQVDGAQGDEWRGSNCWQTAGCQRTKAGCRHQRRLLHFPKCMVCRRVQAEQFEHSENIVHVP